MQPGLRYLDYCTCPGWYVPLLHPDNNGGQQRATGNGNQNKTPHHLPSHLRMPDPPPASYYIHADHS